MKHLSEWVSPPKLGGVAARSRNGAKQPNERTGWFPSRNVSGCIPKTLGFGTTPSVRPEVAVASFLDRTATAPNLAGDTRVLIPALLLSLLLAVVIVAQKKPEISVSPARVKSGGLVMLNGTGFTPDRPVLSHLLRPNGTEYNPLRLRANARGELVHKIDTVMLDLGTFEVWIEDEDARIVSNRVKFDVVP